MPPQTKTLPSVAGHSAKLLPSVEVDSYNLELKDDEGLAMERIFRQFSMISRESRHRHGLDHGRPAIF
jgi:hypothetical protein